MFKIQYEYSCIDRRVKLFVNLICDITYSSFNLELCFNIDINKYSAHSFHEKYKIIKLEIVKFAPKNY